MKLHADKADHHTITAYGAGWIAINGQRHTGSLLLSSATGAQAWHCTRLEDLAAGDFDALLARLPEKPELLILGSGSRLRFVHPSLLQGLMARHIGVETMDTAAACRTFNILAAEGRRVAAALLMGD
jgi:uncharacterized protein